LEETWEVEEEQINEMKQDLQGGLLVPKIYQQLQHYAASFQKVKYQIQPLTFYSHYKRKTFMKCKNHTDFSWSNCTLKIELLCSKLDVITARY
jgi:hypothetical protein